MTSPAAAKRASSGSRSRALALVTGAVVLVLVLVGGLAYRLSRDDGGTSTGGSTASSSPTTGSGYQVKKGDEEKAIASFAATLVETGELTEKQASCLAFQVIRSVGLQRMVDIGMFDEDMNFLNIDLADHPDVKDAISSAALTCVKPG